MNSCQVYLTMVPKMNFKRYYVTTVEHENGESFYEYSSGPHDYGTAWDLMESLNSDSNKEYKVVSINTACRVE